MSSQDGMPSEDVCRAAEEAAFAADADPNREPFAGLRAAVKVAYVAGFKAAAQRVIDADEADPSPLASEAYAEACRILDEVSE